MNDTANVDTRRLLVINPNTSASITGLLKSHVQSAAGPGVQVSACTARFGAPYIVDEASYAVAGHAALDAWAAAVSDASSDPSQGAAPDSILIGCFGDPGLFALRECSPVPVVGLAEAAFIEAAHHGRFAIVTGGSKWEPMLRRLAQALGYGDLLAGIRAVAPTGAELAADPIAAAAMLGQACIDAVRELGVQSVILGGAGLAGMAARLHAARVEAGVPIIDSVAAGARQALPGTVDSTRRSSAGFDVPWINMSPELMALGLPGKT